MLPTATNPESASQLTGHSGTLAQGSALTLGAAMKTSDGFGNTWLTNWRRAADAPRRTLVFAFVLTTLGVALGDYFISERESVRLSVRLGLACGLIVASIVYRKMKSYQRGDPS